jgi:hypothetical protein
MDFSMIVMGNDALLTDVKIKQIKGGPKSAVVDASFRNLGKATTVTYDLLRDKRGWMIDEMRSGCYVLSEALQQKSKMLIARFTSAACRRRRPRAAKQSRP